MWQKIIGHTRQIEELKRSLTEGRLPNAWLFSGMRGLGKRLVAQTLASALICRAKNSPCGGCTACLKISSNSHPDFFMIEPEKDRVLIDQIRDLTQKVQFHPLEADVKIAIVDDADAMTDAAANSLLKVLEEPPPNTHFILISAAAHRILPTIRSRSRRITFSPLIDDEIAGYLTKTLGWDESQAARAARMAQGSLGIAISLTPEIVNVVLERFESITKRGAAADIITTSEEWASDATQIPIILDVLQGFFRDRLRDSVKSGSDSATLRRQLEGLGKIATTRDISETAANKQLMFEELLFSLNQ